jgi:hypothetical protein
MYKKLLNAKPSPDGSPEHVRWMAAAAADVFYDHKSDDNDDCYVPTWPFLSHIQASCSCITAAMSL